MPVMKIIRHKTFPVVYTKNSKIRESFLPQKFHGIRYVQLDAPATLIPGGTFLSFTFIGFSCSFVCTLLFVATFISFVSALPLRTSDVVALNFSPARMITQQLMHGQVAA